MIFNHHRFFRHRKTRRCYRRSVLVDLPFSSLPFSPLPFPFLFSSAFPLEAGRLFYFVRKKYTKAQPEKTELMNLPAEGKTNSPDVVARG